MLQPRDGREAVMVLKPADAPVGTAAMPGRGEVHVFSVLIDLTPERAERCRPILSDDERSRADAFLRTEDRIRFTAARCWLRRMLAARLGGAPEMLVFAYGAQGKPALPGIVGAMHFNLSHSGDRALLAIACGFPLGADIEAIRPVRERVAESFFSRREIQVLARLPAEEREAAFFRCWCRKESYLKALGSGLATPLDAFSVSLAPGEEARLLEVRGAPGEAGAWQIAHLDPGPGYAAAVAARSRGWTIVDPDGAFTR